MNSKALFNLTLLFVLFLFACKEEESAVNTIAVSSNDHRDQFLGTYTGVVECSYEFSPDSMLFQKHNDTLLVQKEVQSIDSIWINNWLLPLPENGHFHAYYAVPGYDELYFEFRNDSLYIKTVSESMGMRSYCNWKTRRIK